MHLSTLAIQKALQNDWESAIDLNIQILTENGDDVDAMNRLAQAYFQVGQVAKARKLYNQVLSIDRFNPIAKRNLQRLTGLKNGTSNTENISSGQHFTFIEEPGKTKVVTLVHLGDPTFLSKLCACTPLKMHFRAQNVCLYYKKLYVGRLPNDIAKRLLWLCKRKNEYACYIKSVDKKKVTVFIRETMKSKENENYSSFQIFDPNRQVNTPSTSA